jgi:hypothetical protein
MPTPERRKMALDQLAQSAAKAGEGSEGFVMNEQFQQGMLDLVQNEFLSRGAMIQKWMDPRRDYNKECGYPETYEVSTEKWREYFERHPVAARVVELMPSECWQVIPDAIEDEDQNITTPFEQAFEDLATTLRGAQSHFRPDEKETHPLWEACRRADILSGIGQFGVILLGFDDGLSLNQPVEGWQEQESGPVTWNQEALPFLHENISKHITVNDRGELVWNAPPEEEEEEKIDAKGNGKKKKKKKGSFPTIKKEQLPPQAEGEEVPPTKDREPLKGQEPSPRGLPPEPLEDDKGTQSQPSLQAFGNINPQQGKYRDPMDTSGQNDVKPYEDPTAADQRINPGEDQGSKFEEESKNSGIQPFQEQEEGRSRTRTADATRRSATAPLHASIS